MRRIARLSLLYLLEAIAALLALAVVAFGAALWRLAEGPVNAEMIRPVVTEVLLDAVKGDAAAIGDLEISFDPAYAALVVTARDVSISRADGDVIIASDQIEAGVALDLLMTGRIAPVSLEASGGTLWLYRDALGRLTGGLGALEDRFGASRQSDDAVPDFDMNQASRVFARLLRVDVSDVTLQMRDEYHDWTGLFTGMGGVLELTDGALSLRAQGGLVTSAGLAPITLDVQSGRSLESVFVEARLSDLVPAATAPMQGPFTGLAALDAPFDMHLVFDASREAGLRQASLQMEADTGVIRSGGQQTAIRTARIDAALDVEAGRLDLHDLSVDSDLLTLSLSGALHDFSTYDDAIPARALYELTSGAGRLDLNGVFPEPLHWNSADLAGRLDIDERLISFETLNAVLPAATARFTGSLAIEDTDAGLRPTVKLNGPVEGTLSKADVLNHWPVDFALGARDWVRDSILDGRINGATLDLNLRAEALAAKAIEDEDLTLSFNFTDADVRYMSTMTPLMGLSGNAVLRGNSLSLEGAGGRIGDIEATRIYVDIPRLNPKGAIARFGGSGVGDVDDILMLVSEPPLNLASEYGFSPQSFGGHGALSFEIRRPMLRSVPAEDLGYEFSGEFEDVSGPAGPPGIDLSDGTVAISVTPEGLNAEGDARIASADAHIVWSETFGLGPDADPTQVRVSSVMTARELDQIGLPLRRFMDGAVGVEAVLTGRGLEFSQVSLDLDLDDAAIALPANLWDKPSGEPATAALSANISNEGAIRLDRLQLNGEGVVLDTSAELAEDGRLLSAEAARVFIRDRMDLSAEISRPDGPEGVLDIAVSGPFLDARDLFGMAAPSGGGDLNAAVNFEGVLGRVLVRDQAFTNVGLTLNTRPEGVARFVLEADAAGGPVIVRFEPEEGSGVRRLSALGPDAGLLLSAFAGFDNIYGGALMLNGVAPPLGQPGGVSGEIEVENFTLNRMPLLARILAAGSLEGLGGLLSGQGIGFERLESQFVWQDGILEMRDSRVAGPSLGATWTGLVDFSEERLTVNGTLLPSYGVNSILGSVPVLGELFTSRQGEGVIGVTFSVSGPFSETRVTANPLSALAPGVFRRIFEGTSAERELDALEAERRAEQAEAAQEEEAEAPEPTASEPTPETESQQDTP
ncbi:AsmA-like C-terminal region-containing protein [Oceanicaulis sp. LC35]|uniref:YhdP family protein n=1 Tax=Oceanicaulis sp. LC35 TaxID=3349635 RepID=UPI003F85D0C3